MSSLVYPAALPGLTFNNTRSPNYNTGVQPALSGKESCLAYQLYPIMEFDLQYEYLDGRNQSNSDIRALLGLFMSMKGQADTFLFNDPEFNTVSLMPFATTDGVTTAFQTTATYQNVGGPGGAEIIQNFNGAPVYYLDRYGTLNELLSPVSRTQQILQSQDVENVVWTKTNITITADAAFAPDGALTADSFVEAAGTNVAHSLAQSVTVAATAGLAMTFSAFIVGSGRGWCFLQLTEATGGSSCTAWFNISTGQVGTVTAGANWSNVSATIGLTNLGFSPWMRVSITATKTNAATSIACTLQSATGDTNVTYTGSLIICFRVWGFQFELGSLPTLYLPTVAAAVTQTDYTLGATGIITTAIAYAAAAILSWTGSFFYRCRFTDDKMTVSQFVNKFWENKSVTLRQKKL